MALVEPIFFDTSVLLGGFIEMGPATLAAQKLIDAVAERRLENVHSSWHCCLEFFQIATHLPPPLRLTPREALDLINNEFLVFLIIHQLPGEDWSDFLRAVERDNAAQEKVYENYIAEIARYSGAKVMVTENRDRYASLLQHGIRIWTCQETLDAWEG